MLGRNIEMFNSRKMNVDSLVHHIHLLPICSSAFAKPHKGVPSMVCATSNNNYKHLKVHQKTINGIVCISVEMVSAQVRAMKCKNRISEMEPLTFEPHRKIKVNEREKARERKNNPK